MDELSFLVALHAAPRDSVLVMFYRSGPPVMASMHAPIIHRFGTCIAEGGTNVVLEMLSRKTISVQLMTRMEYMELDPPLTKQVCSVCGVKMEAHP